MKRAAAVLLTALFVCASIPCALAGDPEYIMMHGGQDALVIGEITGFEDGFWIVEVMDNVPCAGGRTRPLPLEPIRVEDFKEYIYFRRYNDAINRSYLLEEGQPKTGDCILASLNKKGDIYRRANGVYRADTADYATLHIECGGGSVRGALMVQTFVNSGGAVTEYNGVGDLTYAMIDGEWAVIYPPAETPAPTVASTYRPAATPIVIPTPQPAAISGAVQESQPAGGPMDTTVPEKEAAVSTWNLFGGALPLAAIAALLSAAVVAAITRKRRV